MIAAAALALGALAGAALAEPSLTSPVDAMNLFSKRISSGCSTSGAASCHNTTRETDLCCFESPGVRPSCFVRGERCADPTRAGSAPPDAVLGHGPLNGPVKQLDHPRCVSDAWQSE